METDRISDNKPTKGVATCTWEFEATLAEREAVMGVGGGEETGPGKRKRAKVRSQRIENVGKSQSCMFSKLRLICAKVRSQTYQEQNSEWSKAWDSLQAQGWTHQTHRVASGQLVNYYVPKGVARESSETKSRVDYFDSRKQVPSPLHQYRDRVCKKLLKWLGFTPTNSEMP